MIFFTVINNSIVILFEDKVNSTIHDEQLERYVRTIDSEFSKKIIERVYLKTDIVWKEERTEILKNGFKLVDLLELVEVLKPETNNAIYDDFVDHINLKLKDYKSYKITPCVEWNKQAWDGFLYELAPELKSSHYGKHFLGESFWFHLSWRENLLHNKCNISLEFCDKKCVVKAHVYTEDVNKRNYRDMITPKMHKAFKSFEPKIRNRSGKSVILLEFVDCFVVDADGLILFDETVIRLKEMIRVFNNIEY